MQVSEDYRQLRALLAARAGSIGFVPTMGALHAGHRALIERARAENDVVVASIFVNPLQFAPNEDLQAYPRPLSDDSALLQQAGADFLYVPTPEIMYPQGFATQIRVAGLSDVLCGAVRKGHFDGVCTVVAKLLLQVQPQRAYFGEKDYQQLLIIRRLCEDINLLPEVVAVPTQREDDGLALSSRNRYLTPQERAIAPQLYAHLQRIGSAIQHGDAVEKLLAGGKVDLVNAGFASVDYLDYCDAATLAPLTHYSAGARLLVAARLGKARLIDNVEVD